MRHSLFLEKNESFLGCVLSLFALLKSKFKELGPAGSGSVSRSSCGQVMLPQE